MNPGVAVSAAAGAYAAVLLLPVLSDGMSLLRPKRRRLRDEGRPGMPRGLPPRLLFLVPAHDEELLIARTIRSLAAQRYPADRITIVVVADNCSDRTAAIAREAGAEVLERHDTSRRGKPYALAWAIERLDLDRHDAVVVVDADSAVAPDFAAALARHAPLRGKAFQTFNDVRNRTENSITRMAAVFSTMRFLVMNVVKQRAGLGVPFGNGLVLGTAVLRREGWRAFSLSEDWELYVQMVTAGVRIENVPEARIFAQEARSLKQSSSQRKRWSAGRMQVVRDWLPRLWRSRRTRFHQKLDATSELLQPGPAVHLGSAALLCGALAVARPTGWATAATLLGLSLVRPALYTVLAIGRIEEPVKSAAAFAFLPFYAIWRLSLQAGTVRTFVGGHSWVRTQRHVEAGHG